MGRPAPGYVFNVVSLPREVVDDEHLDWVRGALVFENADEREIEAYHLTDDRLILPRGAWRGSPLSKDIEVDDHTSTRPVKFPEPLFEARDYQVRPLQKLSKKGYGVLLAPTGSGKTIMMLLLLAMLGQRTLVIVHTKDLLDQWITRAKDVFGEDFEVGIIGDGEHIERNLTVATVQTLSRMGDLPTDWVQQWGTVILDECHRAPATSFADVMQQMTAKYVFGATATPKRRDGMHPLLHAIIGPIVATVQKTALVDAGKLMHPTVEMIPTDFWTSEATRMENAANQFMRNKWYGQMISRLAEDEERARLVASNIARFPDRHQLILSDRIGHLYLIAEMLDDLDPMSSHFVLTGKHSSQQRQDVIEGVRTGYFKRLFATQLADEGLDIPVLDVLHLTFPRSTKGEGQKLTQQIGRIMRTAEGKQTPLVLDYIDLRVAVLKNQGQARFEHYRLNEMEVSGWMPEKYAKAMQIRDRVRARREARKKRR